MTEEQKAKALAAYEKMINSTSQSFKFAGEIAEADGETKFIKRCDVQQFADHGETIRAALAPVAGYPASPAAVTETEPVAWQIDPGRGSAMDRFQNYYPLAFQEAEIIERGGSITPLYAAPVADRADEPECPRCEVCDGESCGPEECQTEPDDEEIFAHPSIDRADKLLAALKRVQILYENDLIAEARKCIDKAIQQHEAGQ